MIPLYCDPYFTFRFADDRLVDRFCLEEVPQGKIVSLYRIDPETSSRLALLARATVGAGGWVDLTEPLVMRAGEAFIAVPELPR